MSYVAGRAYRFIGTHLFCLCVSDAGPGSDGYIIFPEYPGLGPLQSGDPQTPAGEEYIPDGSAPVGRRIGDIAEADGGVGCVVIGAFISGDDPTRGLTLLQARDGRDKPLCYFQQYTKAA